MDLSQTLIDIAIEHNMIICEDEDGIYFGDPDNPEHVKEQIPMPEQTQLYLANGWGEFDL